MAVDFQRSQKTGKRMLVLRVQSWRAARQQAPWAEVCAKCVNGYIAFEKREDYQRWRAHWRAVLNNSTRR